MSATHSDLYRLLSTRMIILLLWGLFHFQPMDGSNALKTMVQTSKSTVFEDKWTSESTQPYHRVKME